MTDDQGNQGGFLGKLMKKGREMAQDPQNKEKLKNMAQKRFGGGAQGGTDAAEGTHESGTHGEYGVEDASGMDDSTTHGESAGSDTYSETTDTGTDSGSRS